jgi:hypothetical protein
MKISLYCFFLNTNLTFGEQLLPLAPLSKLTVLGISKHFHDYVITHDCFLAGKNVCRTHDTMMTKISTFFFFKFELSINFCILVF